MCYRKSVNRFILEAARRIRRAMILRAGGRLPRTLNGWKALCDSFGLPAGALWDCPSRFTAKLERDERIWDGWLIVYNPYAAAKKIIRFLCHELAEWIAIGDYPSLFDGLPGQVFAYTGGSDPTDARHRIARQVEYLSFRT